VSTDYTVGVKHKAHERARLIAAGKVPERAPAPVPGPAPLMLPAAIPEGKGAREPDVLTWKQRRTREVILNNIHRAPSNALAEGDEERICEWGTCHDDATHGHLFAWSDGMVWVCKTHDDLLQRLVK